jgi:hypothetical protein
MTAATRRWSPSDYSILVGILIIALGFRLLMIMMIPLWQGPDEAAHVEYVRYIVDRHALPTVAESATESTYEYYQPPLYYITMAFLWFATPDSPVEIQVRFFRVMNALLSLISLVASFHLARIVVPGAVEVRLAVVAFMAFLPTYVGNSSTLNNDVMSYAFASVGFLLFAGIVRSRTIRLRSAVMLGLVVGLGLLTKTTLLPVAGAMVLGLWVVESSRRTRAIGIAVFLLMLAVTAAPWYLRDLWFYGSPLVFGNRAITSDLWTVGQMFWTFWAAFGEFNQIASPLGNRLFFVSTLIGVSGAALCLWRRRHSVGPDARKLISVFGLAVCFQIAAVCYYGFAYGQGQGRFLYPVLPLIAIVVVLGWRECLPSGLRTALPVFVGTVMVGALTLYLVAVVRPAFVLINVP